jgi:HPt (histidine-containing phosphotransfer) domain-containing protein
MDVQMPEKDGLETTMELRKDRAFESTIIIAMTAFAMDGDKEKCLEAGMNDYTVKPIRIEGVQNIIERWAEKINIIKTKGIGSTALVIDKQSISRLKVLAPENDGAFVKSILELFIKQLDKLVPETENYFLAGDWDNMYKSAHKLKGSAVNVGAKLLANYCLVIEEKGKVSNTVGLKADISDLKNAADKTKSELRTLGY